MEPAVLDSSAILAYLFGEEGNPLVIEVLQAAAQEGSRVALSAPNWAEVSYVVQRRAGADRWHDTRTKLLALPIEIVPADQALSEGAASLKAKYSISLAAAYAPALAQARDARLYTGDPELAKLKDPVRIVCLTTKKRHGGHV